MEPAVLGQGPCMQETRIAVIKLVAERNELQEQLEYLKCACAELHSQNEHLQKLLCDAQDALPPRKDPCYDQAVASTTWVGGTWLSPSTLIPALAPVQKAWLNGKTQHALALLTEILVQKDLAPYDRIEAGLLVSTIMRSSGDLAQALRNAEIALRVAQNEQMPDLGGKAQFHRGLCYFYQDRYADARWCFILASHTKGHRDIVQINLQMAEENIRNLPFGHPGARLNITS